MVDNECLICFYDLDSEDKAVLSCNHIFHYSCIQEWINKKQNIFEICPICNIKGEIINIIESQSIYQDINYQNTNTNTNNHIPNINNHIPNTNNQNHNHIPNNHIQNHNHNHIPNNHIPNNNNHIPNNNNHIPNNNNPKPFFRCCNIL